MNHIKVKIGALLMALCTAVGIAVVAAPSAQAGAYIECMKNVTTSQFYFTVQFQNQSNFSYYNDAINLGEISGECGNTNVFAEPIKFRIPPGNHARFRQRGGPCGATVAGAWTPYYNAPAGTYPNGRWVNYAYLSGSPTGECVIWETEERSGLV